MSRLLLPLYWIVGMLLMLWDWVKKKLPKY